MIVVQSLSRVSLRPHGLQHTRLPCLLLFPRVCSNLCPLSQWCHSTISSSAAPFSSCPSVFASVRVFSNESAVCIRWPEYCSFSVSKKSKQQTALPGPLCELQVSLVIMRGMGHSPGGPTGVGVTKRSASRSVFPPMKWNDHFARLPWVHVC